MGKEIYPQISKKKHSKAAVTKVSKQATHLEKNV